MKMSIVCAFMDQVRRARGVKYFIHLIGIIKSKHYIRCLLIGYA